MAFRNISITLAFLLISIAVSVILWRLTGWFIFFLFIPFVFFWTKKKR